MGHTRELVIVGDRLLIKPEGSLDRTKHGLYLPQTVAESEKVQSGTVIKVGPGFPVADANALQDEPWKASTAKKTHYVPLQAQPGDHAIFLRDAAIEVEFEGVKYVIVPHSAILLLVRDQVQVALDHLTENT